MKSKKNLSITSCLLALEPRIMFDAAGAVGALDNIADIDHNSTDPLAQSKTTHTGQNDAQSMLSMFEDFTPPVAALSSKEVIIIDSKVQDYQQLIHDVPSDTRVIVLDSSKDGIQQISDTLSNFKNLDAVHIVSHGDSGSLQIGNSIFNSQSLNENSSQVAIWGQSMSEGGDIMLYGCDVAQGVEGQLFMHRLSELTQTDVAASTDPTGHETLGGDWDLEEQTGSIETAIAFSEATREKYANIFADTPTPIGSEFLINTPSTSFSPLPDVAALDGGGFVTVWQAFNEPWDPSDYGIYARQYDDTGSLVGGTIAVNTYTTANQIDPQVTGLSGGGFAVTWSSNGQDGSNHGVYTRIYDNGGSPVTGEIQVNTYTVNGQKEPDIARLSSGNFVVVWESVAQDGDLYGVYGRQLNAAGTPLTAEFQINTTITSWQDTASITALNDGGFVVTWESFNQDGDQEGVFGRRYDAAASPVGGEFQINTTTGNNQVEPSITSLADGGFVVVWASQGQDGSDFGSYGQRYDAGGTEVGSEFSINSYTTDIQDVPRVTGMQDGGFVVTWSSMGQDGSDFGIYGQRFDAGGAALGSEFLINTTTNNAQDESAITTLANGDFVVLWESADASYGTYGQMFTTNFSPVLDNTGSMELASIPKTASDPLGDRVVDIISSAGGDRISDIDTGDPEGIAVTNVEETNGTWWFSTDNGTSWVSMTGASNTSAVLLAADANTRIRFVPDGTNFGTNNITFRAWDQTDGSNGSTGVDTTSNGGNTPFSTATETASIYIDDIPNLVSGAVIAYTENDPPTVIDNSILLTDDSADMVSAKIRISANYIEGEDILSFTPVGSITGIWDAPSATLTLSGVDTIANYQIALRSVTFESSSDNPGEMGGLSRTISFDVDDGMSTSPVVTSTVNITAVNDAPVADPVPHYELFYRDSPEINSGVSLAEEMAGDTDMDGDPLGIAVVSVDDTNGVWQYTINGGTTWINFGGVSNVNATLLAPTTDTRIRFIPNDTTFTGTAEMNIRSWDQTAGTHGQTSVNVSVNGGTTPYSVDEELVSFDIQDIPFIPPPDTTGEPMPPPGAGNLFPDNFFDPVVDGNGNDPGLISDTLGELADIFEPPLPLEPPTLPMVTLGEAPAEPISEDIMENNDGLLLEEYSDDLPPEDDMMEDDGEEQVLEEGDEGEDSLEDTDFDEAGLEETSPDETSLEKDANAEPLVDGEIMPLDKPLSPAQAAAELALESSTETAAIQGDQSLTKQLSQEAQKAIIETKQVLEIFEEVYELLQCK